jgi:YegS/Rv2252/BmrU family lipid kinase
MPPKRLIAVVNPRGGTRRGLAVLEQVKPVFSQAGVKLDVRVTERPGHAREIARTADLSGCDGLCLIGGDGTIHEAADGLMQRGEPPSVPLAIIPAGSGNTMHQHLGCMDPIEAARNIVAGNTRALDVARTMLCEEVIYCVDIVGWGAVADINQAAEKLRRLGPPRYAVAALWHILKARRRPARLVLDGRTIDDEFFFIIGCNTKFTGKGMQLAPRAEIGDGLIDVVVLRRASRVQMFKLFRRVFDGSHVAMDCVEYYQVRSFAIQSAGREPLDLDGEMKGRAPVRVEMMPGALRVFA